MTLEIRGLGDADPEVIAVAFARMGWRKPAGQYRRYLAEQAAGAAVVLVAEVDGVFAGYLKVEWSSGYEPFRAGGIPEIVDLNVVAPFRRRGVATALMDRAEALASGRSREVGIGVGLHPGYNAAQVLYARRGYVPDGRGVTWRGAFVREGDTVVADDDLVLHLTREVGKER